MFSLALSPQTVLLELRTSIEVLNGLVEAFEQPIPGCDTYGDTEAFTRSSVNGLLYVCGKLQNVAALLAER